MAKIIRLTESDLMRIVKKVIKEQTDDLNTNFSVKKSPNKKYHIWATTKYDTTPNFAKDIFPSLRFVDEVSNGFEKEQDALNYIEKLKTMKLVSKKQIDMKDVELFEDPQQTKKVFTPTLAYQTRYIDELIFLGYLEHGEKVNLTYTCGNDFLEDKIKKVKYYNKRYTDLLKLYTMCDLLKSPEKKPDF